MTELMLRREVVHLGDGEGNSGICWAWQFELPYNPGSVTLRLEVASSQNSQENEVFFNKIAVGHLKKSSGDGYESDVLVIPDNAVANGFKDHHTVEIFSGFLHPSSHSDWSRDDIYLRNIKVVHS